MTQYDERVELQRLKIEAEEWAKGFRSLQVHSLQSMWYDDRPKDTADGANVTDVQYNDGTVHRSKNGKLIHVFGKPLKGKDLIESYVKHQQG